MKKAISFLLTLIMMCTLWFPSAALGAEDQELEKAIVKAKQLFAIGKEYDGFQYNLNKLKGKTVYHLSWNDTKNKLGNISVTIDSKDFVSNYYRFHPEKDDLRRRLPAISKADALKKANDFIKKVNPSIVGKIRYDEKQIPFDINYPVYRFSYIRIENEILLPENTISIELSGVTGEVRNFYSNWTEEVSFPSKKDGMSLEKAKQVYKEKLGLQLVYKLKYDQDTVTPYLVYTNIKGNQYIDAVTGEIVSGRTYYYEKQATSMKDEGMRRDETVISPKEKEAIEKLGNLISEQRAEEAARKFLKLSPEYILRNIQLHSSSGFGSPGNYVWNMNFTIDNKDNKEEYNVSVSIDAKTEEIMNFYRSMPYKQDESPQYDKEQTLQIAKDFIQTLQKDKAKEIEYVDWNQYDEIIMEKQEKPRQYNFQFVRKSNGAYFMENGFYITVDAVTGTVLHYNYTWYKGSLPSASKAISLEKAYDTLFGQIGLRLQYILQYNKKNTDRKILPYPNGETDVTPEAKMVYGIQPDKPVSIDASSGKLLGYDGRPYVEPNVKAYTDIKGSSAEAIIKVLAEYGIAFPEDSFQPKKKITQMELLYLLAKANAGYMDIALDEKAVYEYALRASIIKEKEKAPSAAVTKQEALKFLVRALGYGKVAELKGIYTVPFKDANAIHPDVKGYVAIAYGLNLAKVKDGKLNPTEVITREKAAELLYDFLNVER